MNMKVIVFATMLFGASLGVIAQEPDQIIPIDFTPVACFPSGQMAALTIPAPVPGQIRAYFRRLHTLDWCSVQGVYNGNASNVMMPRFDDGEEIEYYFIVLNKERIVARTPRVYRAKVTERCETTIARHSELIIMDCRAGVPNAGPGSVGSGIAIRSTPATPSPSSPAIQ
jgi:hypothetical protein